MTDVLESIIFLLTVTWLYLVWREVKELHKDDEEDDGGYFTN